MYALVLSTLTVSSNAPVPPVREIRLERVYGDWELQSASTTFTVTLNQDGTVVSRNAKYRGCVWRGTWKLAGDVITVKEDCYVDGTTTKLYDVETTYTVTLRSNHHGNIWGTSYPSGPTFKRAYGNK